MLRLTADENFNGHIVRGLLRRDPTIDIVRAQDVGLAGREDPDVLAWCAEHGRVLLTHDLETIARFAGERVEKGLPMPGVVEVPDRLPIGRAIDDLLLLDGASAEGEWEGQVLFLPL